MRTRGARQVQVESGWLVVGDLTAHGYPLGRLVHAVGGAVPPRYRVYQRGDLFVVDLSPSVFRAGARSDFALHGEFRVQNELVCIVDATPDELALSRAALDSGAALLLPLSQGLYQFWIEEKDSSEAESKCILGIGPELTLLLSGPDANQIHRIEKALAVVLRQKGRRRQEGLESLRTEVMDLHLAGCRDRRLEMIAQVLKLHLPTKWELRMAEKDAPG
jgi:hypothetical protein